MPFQSLLALPRRTGRRGDSNRQQRRRCFPVDRQRDMSVLVYSVHWKQQESYCHLAKAATRAATALQQEQGVTL